MYFYFLLFFSFYLISGKEPYHGCTDIKPLLLLLLLLFIIIIIIIIIIMWTPLSISAYQYGPLYTPPSPTKLILFRFSSETAKATK